MTKIFNREALFSTAVVTATITTVTAAALAVADGPVLIAPFAAAALGFSYHMGVSRGMELSKAAEQQINALPEDAPSPR